MWWDSLTDYQQVLFYIAVAATVVMVIFIILMFMGFDHTQFDGFDGGIDGMDDLDFDVHADGIDHFNDEPLSSVGGLKIFTIRGTLAFLSVGSWVTMLFFDYMHPIFATLIGAFAGFIAAVLLSYALKQTMILESSVNNYYNNAVGKTATVYMRIPKNNSGKGKINLVIDDRYVEVDAVTHDQEDILPNQSVTILDVTDGTSLIVKKI